jgi:hypothetical protein
VSVAGPDDRIIQAPEIFSGAFFACYTAPQENEGRVSRKDIPDPGLRLPST